MSPLRFLLLVAVAASAADVLVDAAAVAADAADAADAVAVADVLMTEDAAMEDKLCGCVDAGKGADATSQAVCVCLGDTCRYSVSGEEDKDVIAEEVVACMAETADIGMSGQAEVTTAPSSGGRVKRSYWRCWRDCSPMRICRRGRCRTIRQCRRVCNA